MKSFDLFLIIFRSLAHCETQTSFIRARIRIILTHENNPKYTLMLCASINSQFMLLFCFEGAFEPHAKNSKCASAALAPRFGASRVVEHGHSILFDYPPMRLVRMLSFDYTAERSKVV
jgi:hypothetical protein